MFHYKIAWTVSSTTDDELRKVTFNNIRVQVRKSNYLLHINAYMDHYTGGLYHCFGELKVFTSAQGVKLPSDKMQRDIEKKQNTFLCLFLASS